MLFSILEDIRPITDLKKHMREVLDQVRKTGRPVILTVNGRADPVLLDAKTYEKHLKARNLARMRGPAGRCRGRQNQADPRLLARV